MMRVLGVTLVAALLAIWCGCPQPLEQQDDGQPRSRTRIAAGAEQALPDGGAPDEDGAVEEHEPEEEAGSGEDDESPVDDQAAADDAAGSYAELLDADEAEPIEGEDALPEAMDADTAEEPVEVVEEPEPEPQTALDPERLLAAEDEEPAYEHPPARVSRGSVAFAGRWSVVILSLDGRARQSEYDDEWVFELSDDGRCTVSQRVGGDLLTQRGGWEYASDVLTLLMGPGGQRRYHVDSCRADVATLTDTLSGAVLFCLRQEEAADEPEVRRSYLTNFGELKLRRTGQSWWRSTYGEPEGTVLVRQVGRFLVGTWEQQPDRGFVIFELMGAGLDGWWWYQDSLSYDGEWRVPDPA